MAPVDLKKKASSRAASGTAKTVNGADHIESMVESTKSVTVDAMVL